MKLFSTAFFALFFVSFCSYGQKITTDSSLTAQQLIEDILTEGCVETTNIQSNSNGSASGITSFARFDRASSSFPFESGIVISTGNVNSVGNSDINPALGDGNTTWGTDSDIETALGVTNTLNATSIEFDFVSLTNTLAFNYLFASEEYEGEFPCNLGSDSFVFLIKETGSTDPYTNIAVIPGTTAPVNIGNIRPDISGLCAAENEEYFGGYLNGDTNFFGRTKVLTASANIVPNQSYHIKLIIADQTDQFFDSAVFIEGSSFNTPLNLGADVSSCLPSHELFADLGNPLAVYSWYLNDVLIPDASETSYTATENGTYRIRADVPINSTTCVIEDEISVVLNTETSITPVSDFILCDITNPGDEVEFFDLNLKDEEFLDNLPHRDFAISYHNSDADARNNVGAILNPIEANQTGQEIFVRIFDNTSNCLGYATFDIRVTESIEFTIPTAFEICASQEDASFGLEDFSTTTEEIINGNPNLSVSYYTSQADTDAERNALRLPYRVNAPAQTIFIRVADLNSDCVGTTSVDVTVNSIPNLVPGDYFIDACEVDNDGFEVFDMTTLEPIILGGISDVTVSYYATNSDAVDATNPILNPTSYTNTTQFLQTVFIRVENNTTACFAIESIDLHTDVLTTGTSISDIGACDDSSNDGFSLFNFGMIAQNFTNDLPNVSIRFYETESDRDNRINELDQTINYTNTTARLQPIFMVLNSPTCEEVSQFNLVVLPYFELTPVAPVEICDEDDDARTTIDLSQYDAYVSNNLANVSVEYYLSEADARFAIGSPISKSYTNTTDPLVVFARVMNTLTGCTAVNSLDIDVLPAPTVATPTSIIICDDDQDGVFNFDLTTKINEITATTTDLTIDFYTNFSDANSNTNPIANPTNYSLSTQTLFSRVTNNTTNCYQVVSFDAIVNTLPVFTPISNYTDCEVNSDGSGAFVFRSKDSEILGSQTGKTVLYFETENDANLRQNAINKNSPYTNTANPQIIHVRVENDTDIDCYGISSFEISVREAPIYTAPKDEFLCSDPGGSAIALLDLSAKRTEIITGSPQNLSVSFHTSIAQASLNLNALPDDYLKNLNPEIIYVRIETDEGCVNITENFTISVFNPPLLGPSAIYPVCDNDYDGKTIADLTMADVQILDPRQSGYIIEFYETEADLAADLPISSPEVYQTDGTKTIFVKVTNPLTGCFSTIPLLIQVNLPPAYTPVTSFEFCETADRFIHINEVTPNFEAGPNAQIVYYSSLSSAQLEIRGNTDTYQYSSTSEVVFVRITDDTTDCFYIDSFDLKINPNPAFVVPNDLIACNYDGDFTAEFDLFTQNEAILNGINPAQYLVSYHTTEENAANGSNELSQIYRAANEEIIWFRVTNSETSCFSIDRFSVVINPVPVIEAPNTSTLCLDGAPLEITASLDASDTYEWSTGETSQQIYINEVGDYWVRVTNIFGCEIYKEFNITPAELLKIEVIHFEHPNKVTVEISGAGVYTYQLDDETEQESNVFNDVTADKHKITIYETNGCAALEQDIYVLNYPLYFSPNGSGPASTELWHLQGLKNIPGVSITNVQIFDRNGRLLSSLNESSIGWDGMDRNGILMPSGDYWFKADVSIDDKHTVLTGNFSLLR
ncbi:choice-of-anchor L domain-containing protein [Flavicella sediminum]|uniref:choice-of-anchor L domain-containing protein n=1 Tax=Flavicella sediminum TaxID=2585141 RepID=UPI0011217896|nr:choice-of-anchor L domain-containing protein [Flavicella sediminum]